MATPEQLLERLQRLEAQNQELAAALALAQQQAAAAMPVNDGQRGQVDTRLLGRPESFDGVSVKWKDWPIVFRAYMGAAVPILRDLMARVEGALDQPALNAVLERQEEAASQQMYFVLVMLTKGEALDIVINSGQGEGLEAWRQMVNRFEPRAHSRQAGMLLEILSWDYSGDLLVRMEAMERRIVDYEKSGERLSDSVRIGIVMKQLPDGPIRQHLIMNSERLNTWPVFRDEVTNIRRAQTAVQNAQVPMDVSALEAKGKSKGKGKSNAGANLKDVTCHNCGKKGHYARDCWQKQASGSGKGKGKSEGKGKGNAKKGPTCHRCGGVGHIAKDCATKKEVNALENPAAGNEKPGQIDALFINSVEVTEEVLRGVGATAEMILKMKTLGYIGDRTEKGRQKMVWSVDSGAAVTIVPKSIGVDYPIEDQGNGVVYKDASGGDVHDEGTRMLIGKMKSGSRKVTKGIRTRVGNVTRGLLSVCEVVNVGGEVHFTAGRCWIKRPSGDEVDFVKNGRVFELEMEVLPYSEAKDVLAKDPFGGPAPKKP